LRGGYSVKVDWDGNGTFSGTTEDVSQHVRGYATERGRDFASPQAGRSIAGGIRLEVDNSDGRYTFAGATSDITTAGGTVIPGRLMQVSSDSGAFTYEFPILFTAPRWTGYLTGVSPNPSLRGVNTAVLTGHGPFSRFIDTQVSLVPQDGSVSDLVGTILDAAGWASADRNIKTTQSSLKRVRFDRVGGLFALQQIEDAEVGFVAEDADGKIRFEGRHTRLTAPHTTSVGTLVDAAAAGTLHPSEVRPEDPLKFVFTEVQGTHLGFSTGATATLWTLGSTGTASPVWNPGQKRTFFAQYPNPASTRNAEAVQSWVTPSATLDYVFLATATSGATLTDAMKVTNSKFAESMVLEVENTGTAPAYATKFEARGVPILADDPVTLKAEDATAGTLYGTRTLVNQTKFSNSFEDVENRTRFQLGLTGVPRPLMEVTIPAHRDGAHFQFANTVDISDRVTVLFTGTTGLAITDDFFVEAKKDVVTAKRSHLVTLKLSPVASFASYWVVGISKLGTTTRLAY
jgi:hypothetical protein